MSEGWRTKRLGEVLSLEYGKPLPKEKRLDSGGYPAYGANGIKCYANEPYCTGATIIVGRKGTAGAVNLVDTAFWPLDVTYYLKFDESEYERKYLFYMLTWLDLPSLAKGVKPGINRNDVYALTQRFPCLAEQKHIVAILNEAFVAIDTAIANTEKNLANARELFDSCSSGLLTRNGDSWQRCSLKNIIRIEHGHAFKSKDFHVSDNTDEPIVLTPGNYTHDGELSFTSKNTKRLKVGPPEKFIFAAGDLTVVMTDLSPKMKILGKPAFVPYDNVLHNQRIGRVVFESDAVRPKYLYYCLLSDAVSEEVKQTATGTMVRHTAPNRILAVDISFPQDLRDQDEIIEDLDDLRQATSTLESLYEKKLTALAELKQSLLQKAFSGELTAKTRSLQEVEVA